MPTAATAVKVRKKKETVEIAASRADQRQRWPLNGHQAELHASPQSDDDLTKLRGRSN
jgi:hypothetical protein